MTRVAVVFPGQGSQHPAMGRELAAAYPESREIFELADRSLEEPISRVCFEGNERELALTENTQPAILTVSIAAWQALRRRGLAVDAAAGHSLGEYSAHVAAGTLTFSEAVRTVRLRGRFMQQAVPVGEGAMAAILGLEAGEVARICRAAANGHVVDSANLNAPGQVVIAGHADAVKRAMEACREAGAKRAVTLPVSAPFHCSLMEPAALALRPVLEGLPFREPSFPVFSNVDACAVRDGEAARDALVRQVASPVRWQESIEAMVDAGLDTFIEVGPGRVLAGLVRRIRKEVRVLSVGDPSGVEQAARECGR